MRITYRTLLGLMNKMSDAQLDCDVTVEDGITGECFAAELRITGDNHDSLDDNHPVIYFDGRESDSENDIEFIAKEIGLTPPVVP